jgi:hypothetical protein
MTKDQVRELLDRVLTWPPERQEELARIALAFEAEFDHDMYDLSDEEWADLQEGIAQADRREFVPDEVVAEANKRHGL